MLFGKRIVVVWPAYNAAKTLKRTCEDLPKDAVDDVLLVGYGLRVLRTALTFRLQRWRLIDSALFRPSSDRPQGGSQKQH
jgi:hypothetical protein